MRILFLIILTSISLSAYSLDSLNHVLYNHAANAPDEVSKDIEKLVKYLIEPAKSQMEKAEVIAYWVSLNISYDTEAYKSQTYDGISWESTFDSRKSICSGYAELYKELCSRAGTKCFIISGYAKGYGYNKGDQFREANHAWNIIEIDGGFHLVDITWASGGMTDINGSLTFIPMLKISEIFSKPNYFIEKHFPVNRRWQLLSYPISFDSFLRYEKYNEMKKDSSAYFNYRDSINHYMNLDIYERNINDALEDFKLTSNKKELANTFYRMGYKIVYESYILEKFETAKDYFLKAKNLYLSEHDDESAKLAKSCDLAIRDILHELEIKKK